MSPQLVYRQTPEDGRPDYESAQTQPSEEMHRPGKVLQQKLDGQDVEHDVEGAAESVVRVARDARRVANGTLGDRRPIKAGQRGNEAVQFTVEVNLLEYFGAISLKRRAEISKLNSRRLRHQPVGDARWNLARQCVVHAVLAPSAGDIVAFFDLRQQRWNVLGRVLQIPVQRHANAALRFVETGRER